MDLTGKKSFFTRFKRTIAFMLRLLPFNAQYCGTSIEITDPLVLDIAEKKLIHLMQTDSFPAELKLLTSD